MLLFSPVCFYRPEKSYNLLETIYEELLTTKNSAFYDDQNVHTVLKTTKGFFPLPKIALPQTPYQP